MGSNPPNNYGVMRRCSAARQSCAMSSALLYPRAKAHRQVPQRTRAMIAQRAAIIGNDLTEVA
jgi:hypothetical protein